MRQSNRVTTRSRKADVSAADGQRGRGRFAVVCPDKFRGSLTAPDAAGAMAAGLRRAGYDEVLELPLADGGEGTLDALVGARRGRRRRAGVTGPLGERRWAEYGLLGRRAAVVEMARASGLSLVEGGNDPLAATTRGTGELIAAARRAGARRVLVGVGGSATTDGGLGAVEALGWSLRDLDVVVACDVSTRFTDAARAFAPQKGASGPQVAWLTRRLERLAQRYRAETGVDVTELPGAGAAGGLAGGLAALGARLEPGFDVVASSAGLGEALPGADVVVTGEGRVDAASFEGKVVGGVLSWAATAGVGRAGVVGGRVEPGVGARAEEAFERGRAGGAGAPRPRSRVLSLLERAFDEAEAFERTALLVEEATVELGRWARR